MSRSRFAMAAAIVSVSALVGSPSPWGAGRFGLALAQDAAPAASKPKAQETPIQSVPLPKPPPPDEPPPADGGPRAFMATTDQSILHYQRRVEFNPNDYVSFRILGELYERKAKESGDASCYAKAEEALRQSLKLVPNYPRGRASLAAILCARHKFAEGLEIARQLCRENPKDLDALATMSDALMEIGRYDEAEAAIKELRRQAPVPEALARAANLAEIQGKTDEAIGFLKQAVESIRKLDLPGADAWYSARLGDIAYGAGRIEEAERHYLAVSPNCDPYHDATFGLCRVRAAQGRLSEAIDLGKKAIAIGPDAHMLVYLGELYEQAGQTESAKPLYEQFLKEAAASSEHRRNLAMFLADRDRELPRAVALARLDFAERQDVFGRDALAWALHKNGQSEEAARVIAEALKIGVQDARLLYHAGVIHHRLGDRAKARELLSRALAVNPHFSIKEAANARELLKSSS